MPFKMAEMAKTLRNGLSMSEMDPLNHKWLDFAIKSGLALHQFQLKLLLRATLSLRASLGVRAALWTWLFYMKILLYLARLFLKKLLVKLN